MVDQQAVADPSKWLQKYGNMLYQYALTRVSNEAEAEDLLQETLLAGLKGFSNFKGEASEKNWLYSILKNKIVDYYRKKATNREINQLPDLEGDDDGWFNADGRWPENRMPAEWNPANNNAEKKELRKIIDHCKDALKELQKQVFVLKYMEDHDADFICKVLNISPSNYWVLLHRCRLQMRYCVEKNWQ